MSTAGGRVESASCRTADRAGDPGKVWGTVEAMGKRKSQPQHSREAALQKYPIPEVGAVLDRARGHIPVAALTGLVMNDPGGLDYIRAYTAVLKGGVPALFYVPPGETLRRMEGFDIQENILLAHSDAHMSVTHRWFSVLASCIELYCDPRCEGFDWPPTAWALKTLLVDSHALAELGVADAPLDLLPAAYRAVQDSITWNQPCRALALVCELMSMPLPPPEAEAKCRELTMIHETIQADYAADRDSMPMYVQLSSGWHPAFVWGAGLDPYRRISSGGFEEEMTGWLGLVNDHFPAHPGLVAKTRERLLNEGTDWLTQP